jgi:hypothetical protein
LSDSAPGKAINRSLHLFGFISIEIIPFSHSSASNDLCAVSASSRRTAFEFVCLETQDPAQSDYYHWTPISMVSCAKNCRLGKWRKKWHATGLCSRSQQYGDH